MKKWRLYIFVGILFIIGFTFSFFKGPRNFVWEVFKPINFVFYRTFGQVPGFFKEVAHLRQIVKENQNLVKENLDLQAKLSKLSEIQYENEILKKELNFSKEQASETLVPAAIIGQSPGGYLRYFIIDKGEKDGLIEGQAVISQGFLVGTLANVRADNSEVILINDYNSLVPVILQDSRGTGLLRGGINGLAVGEIPLNIEIKPQENVVTSGLGGQIPAGVPVGKTSSVITKRGEIFQKVLVLSPVDFSRLEVLFVVKK